MSVPSMWRAALLAATLVISIAGIASAQNIATSFEQLRGLVKAGDVVTVIDHSGGLVKGSIVDISPAALKLQLADRHIQKLQLAGRQFQLSGDDVRTISQDR